MIPVTNLQHQSRCSSSEVVSSSQFHVGSPSEGGGQLPVGKTKTKMTGHKSHLTGGSVHIESTETRKLPTTIQLF